MFFPCIYDAQMYTSVASIEKCSSNGLAFVKVALFIRSDGLAGAKSTKVSLRGGQIEIL